MDSQTAYKELKTAQGQQRSAQDIYKTQATQLGVPAAQQRQQELREVLRGTETALKGVESSVTGRTQGGLVTEAQRSRLASLERAPLSEAFGEQQRALTDEQQIYRDLLGEAGQQSGLAYQSQQDRLAQLQQGYQAATEREQAAEEKRRWEVQQALARQQWEAQQQQWEKEFAASRAEAAAATRNWEKYLNPQAQEAKQITADPVAIFKEFNR